MDRADLWIKTLAATVAGIWGGLIAMVQLLLILQALDVATGILSAAGRGQLSSKVSWAGMTKKVSTLLVVVMAGALQSYAGGMVSGLPIVEAVAGFYCANESISILENAVEAGLPVPQTLRDALAKLSPEKPAA